MPIPAKRLKAVPRAEQCVPCLEAMGDVPRLRRYDEFTADGDKVETVFTSNEAIEYQMQRVAQRVPSDSDFLTALRDDSHILPEQNGLGERFVSRHMSTEFEEEDGDSNGEMTLTGREAIRLSNLRRWAAHRVENGLEREGDRELLGLPTTVAATAMTAVQ